MGDRFADKVNQLISINQKDTIVTSSGKSTLATVKKIPVKPIAQSSAVQKQIETIEKQINQFCINFSGKAEKIGFTPKTGTIKSSIVTNK